MMKREFRFILTQFCNYRCFFCHSEGAADSSYDFELTPEDYLFLAIVGQQAWGWDTATLTGGEPLISPIYDRVCRLLSSANMRLTTVTNASLIAKPERLAHNVQLNISLHTTDPQTYSRITRSTYPLEHVLSSIRAVRAKFPDMKLRLNSTIMRGYNERPADMANIIDFAQSVNATPKFIDLAGHSQKLIVSTAEIINSLNLLGFKVVDDGTWKIELRRASDDMSVIVVRCSFAPAHYHLGLHNVLVYADGTMSSGIPNDPPLNVLSEIKSRDAASLVQRMNAHFPSIVI